MVIQPAQRQHRQKAEERPERKWHRVRGIEREKWKENERFREKAKTRRGVGWGTDLGKVSYIIIIPLSNGGAASPGEFVLNGRFARRTGQREREKNGFQSAGNPVYIYIIISTLTSSSSLSLGAFSKKKKKKEDRGKRQMLIHIAWLSLKGGRALGCCLSTFVVVVAAFFFFFCLLLFS